MLQPLPLEIWFLIIDELGAESEYDALSACSNVCPEWQERTKNYILPKMSFRTQEEVASIKFGRELGWGGPREVCIEGGRRSDERLPIPHLRTFASRLARRWTGVETLRIERAEWRVQDLDANTVLLDLSCFDSITHVRLHNVTFPSFLTFARLISAFPRLEELDVCDIDIVKAVIDARTLMALRLLPATKIWRLTLFRPQKVLSSSLSSQPQTLVSEESAEQHDALATRSVGLLQLVTTLVNHESFLMQDRHSRSDPTIRTTRLLRSRLQSVESTVRQLKLWNVTSPTAAPFIRLLCSLPSLQTLIIEGPCEFSRHGLDPREVPVSSGIPSQLTVIKLGHDCCLHSDPLSIVDLVDFFIQIGLGGGLQSLSAWLSPSLHATRRIDIAINRLIKCAGNSLRQLQLSALSQDHLPPDNKASTYAGPSTAPCLNISGNMHLLYIHIDNIANNDDFQIAPVLAVLHQVTSTLLTYIKLTFHVVCEIDLPRLWTSLPQLDAALSRTVFDKLERVQIELCHVESSVLGLEARVRSCLPKLDSRDVLGLDCSCAPHQTKTGSAPLGSSE